MKNFWILGLILAFCFTSVSAETLVIQNGTLLTMGGAGQIDNGTIIVKAGKIFKVGKNIRAPKGAKIVDAKGKFVTPGLFDSFTQLGLVEISGVSATHDADEATEATTPQLFVLDALNPQSKAIALTRRFGVTLALVAPAEGNLISGQSAIIKLAGEIPDEMFLTKAGLHATLGEAPKMRYGARNQMPSTRMGEAALLRQQFLDARSQVEKREHYERQLKLDPKHAKPPARDLKKDAIVSVLRRELPLIISAHRLDDIMTALRIAEEFNIRLILNHGTEAYKIAKILAEREIPVIVGPVRISPSRPETEGAVLENAAILRKAGVKIAFQTAEVHNVRNLQFEGAFASAYGLPEEEALKAMTLYPAQIFGVSDRFGSLEEGKNAHIVIWSEHPLKISSKPEYVLIDGIEIYSQ